MPTDTAKAPARRSTRNLRSTAGAVLRKVAFHGAEAALKASKPRAARRLLAFAAPGLKSYRRHRAAVARAFGGAPAPKPIRQFVQSAIFKEAQLRVERRDYPTLLEMIAQLEAMDQHLPYTVGDLLARQLVTEIGRERIFDAVEQAHADWPDSPFLTYLYCALLAKRGEPHAASEVVAKAIRRIADREISDDKGQIKRARRDFETLRDTWRIIDQIAREDTDWATADGVESYTALARLAEDGGQQGRRLSRFINFKEPLLQARDEDGYLAACQADFDAETATIEKIRRISEMLREGLRRQVTYRRAYDQASACYDLIRDEIQARLDADARALAALPPGQVTETAQIGANAVGILTTLNRTADAEALRGDLLGLAFRILDLPDTKARPAAWLILPELTDSTEGRWDSRANDLRAALPYIPRKAFEFRAYLRWALHTRSFDEAEDVFDNASLALQRSPAALFYVNILQRLGKFATAQRVARDVNARMLSQPARIRPVHHWNLIRRHGELGFLRETADTFRAVAQPTAPEGLLIIAARNIDQLRKYPLAVFLELRRRNWAVVCLVEGLLPPSPTGLPQIDLLDGCITIERGLTDAADAAFPELHDFEAEPSKGQLRWGDLDLSHSLLEDARVSRRVYDVDFDCPALSTSLGKLCDRTRQMARAVHYARALQAKLQLRCGLMSLFNSRLPDSLFRLYCEAHGDADTFFALQTANGYENYFANFSHPISTRCVIRNVTRHAEARSASFPLPKLFAPFVDANAHRAPEILDRVAHIAQAKRVQGAVTTDPAAEACERRIMEWRGDGGNVACLFGRVVCDSAVPFDGGPGHADLRDWLNHSIDAVRGSNTLLLIKPHPHEMNEQIATYLNQYFRDLIDGPLPDNVIYLGHRWFDIAALKRFVDLGTVYNGTVAVEMGLLGIPCIQSNHFGPIDYPLGHPVAQDRDHYARMLRFEDPSETPADLADRAAMWLDYMSNGRFVLDYRYHARPVTNRVVYPPWWVSEDMDAYLRRGDPQVRLLADRILGLADEPAA